MSEYQIVVIGLGGVGTILVERLARFLNYSRDISCKFLLLDGDTYELKNYSRQEFSEIGSKAETKEVELQMKYPRLRFMSENVYITEANIGNYIIINRKAAKVIKILIKIH
jgi:tRNA A37 threonylcarbamoyladenosine dehydratase